MPKPYDPEKSNLRNVPEVLRNRIEAFLANDSVHDFSKESIKAGLMLDPCDAFTNARDVVSILADVADAVVDVDEVVVRVPGG